MAEAVGAGLPFLGVCLGVQLLAAALGARVYEAERAEVGLLEVELTAEGRDDPLFAGFDERFLSLQWHGDTFELPPGAARLARSPLASNQAFRVGERAYGVQFHLEVTGAMAREWGRSPPTAARLRETLGEERGAAFIADVERRGGELHPGARRLFANWLDIGSDGAAMRLYLFVQSPDIVGDRAHPQGADRWPRFSASSTKTPSTAIRRDYPRDDIPPIERYPDGQTTPTPEGIDFTPGELLGCVSGELGLREFLEHEGHELIVTSDKDGSDSEFERRLPEAEVVISQPFWPAYLTAERIAKAPNLKLAITAGIGSDHVDLQAAIENGITVAEVTYCNSISVSEHVVMAILALVRNYMPSYETVIDGGWNIADCASRSYDLEGMQVGTVAAGRIGAAVLRRLKPFEVGLHYTDRHRLPAEVEQELGATFHESAAEMVPLCDVVTINAPLHPETEHLFDDEMLGRMKRGAFLVNTARGKICDRDAVVRALESGQLAGYAGDVWFPQPAPQDHPWRTMPHHGMTPHISGTSLSAQARYAAGTREILECFLGRAADPRGVPDRPGWRARRSRRPLLQRGRCDRRVGGGGALLRAGRGLPVALPRGLLKHPRRPGHRRHLPRGADPRRPRPGRRDLRARCGRGRPATDRRRARPDPGHDRRRSQARGGRVRHGNRCACGRTGISLSLHEFGAEAAQESLEARIAALNDDPTVSGIVLQLPLPDHLDAHRLMELIDPGKDLDGLGLAWASRRGTRMPSCRPPRRGSWRCSITTASSSPGAGRWSSAARWWSEGRSRRCSAGATAPSPSVTRGAATSSRSAGGRRFSSRPRGRHT